MSVTKSYQISKMADATASMFATSSYLGEMTKYSFFGKAADCSYNLPAFVSLSLGKLFRLRKNFCSVNFRVVLGCFITCRSPLLVLHSAQLRATVRFAR